MQRLCAVAILMSGLRLAGAQASALPSAAPRGADQPDHGKALIAQMTTALGGEKWRNRGIERVEGKSAAFYKGNPNPYVAQFEEYYRYKPFGERVVIVSKQGVLIPTTKRDVAEVWTNDGGFEITFRGKKALPVKGVEEFQRRRRHSLDTVLTEWLSQPDTIVGYEGSGMDRERRLVDRVSIVNAENDSVTLALDSNSHLPVSVTYIWRDPVYKDLNTDLDRYDNWQPEDGVMAPLTLTHYHNGDMSGQRFLTKVQYNMQLPEDLFDPDRPLAKSTKK